MSTGRPRWFAAVLAGRQLLPHAGPVGQPESMPRAIREAVYRRQTGARDLTARQRRRAAHKANRALRDAS